MCRCSGQVVSSDATPPPQCLDPKQAWYSFIDPLKGCKAKQDLPSLGFEPRPLFRVGTLGTCLRHKNLDTKKLKLQLEHHRLASHERSISAFKRVKTEMRCSMENEKRSSLMLLCIQNDITMEIDYKDVVNDFVMIKTRRKVLCCTNTLIATQPSVSK
ncbi:hypothetical protein TNCV_2039971 [Trichonephila clavipes]|nr:hypothetical protein TNCV_2039971 [Trichonephila clavipes]